MLHISLGKCGVCDGWRGRAHGTGPSCTATWCPGSMTKETARANKPACNSKGETEAIMVIKARRTAECFGGWEYLVGNTTQQGRKWLPHTAMPTTRSQRLLLRAAQQQGREPHSLRDFLETTYGHGKAGSIGQMEAAVSGRKEQAETVRSLTELVNAFITYAQDQMADEMGDTRWPNLEESTLTEGYRGRRWTQEIQPTISYYRGAREPLPDGKERSRISLQGRADTWEERLPAHLRVSATQVQQVVDAGGGLPARKGTRARKLHADTERSGRTMEGGSGSRRLQPDQQCRTKRRSNHTTLS
jgi:hypothetical protein